MKHALTWVVGPTDDPHRIPSVFVPAVVPGAVQLDWARAHGWPQTEYDPDLSKYAWMEDAFWLYRATLDWSPPPGQRLFFVCQGVDYRCEVRLAGRALHAQEGMFTPIELDITDLAHPGATLEVLVFPAPKSHPAPADRTQANQSCKPAVAYGWDFHPRLIPLGIWDDAYLEARPATHIRATELTYVLSDDLGYADVLLDVALSRLPDAGMRLRWQIVAPSGEIAHEQLAAPGAATIRLSCKVRRPALWWPHDHGDQPRYTSLVELLAANGEVVDRRQERFGFRRVRLVMHPAQWQEVAPYDFPKGRNSSPITLEVNGRRIFARGANWVTPSLFPGTLTEAHYREQLALMKAVHMNIVRCWGGANVQKEAFFDLCDELGILVWQEFPLACNRYEGTPDYLRVLDQESRAIIRRVRRHPSLALWCGGNELFNDWSRMTDQDLALRLLDRNCYDLDPHTPFLMTSPAMGMAHGGYFFRDLNGVEVYRYFAESRATAYTEFGVPAPAGVEVLKQIIPADELWPPRAGTQWETRHAFRAWMPDSWLDLPTLEDYFGPIADLESLVACAQWLQSEGLKAIYEEARRQKPACAMALCWVLNEPWPTAANNSLISWPARPKPGLHAVAQACRPVLASARIPKFSWRAGETLGIQLFMLNDSPEPLGPGCVDVWLEIGEERLEMGDWRFEGGPANENIAGPVLEAVLPVMPAGRFTLMLEVAGKPEWRSRYDLLFRRA
ncbi:MAG: glycoside hydrolase family 2 TIM barrel-domain containing protein [Anaerolineae bacterium]|nr:hypothetical protein [Candidatus Roseilinea sp.]MDW8449591.1 glycoside hydrolase family 2 TIM barrel-domain containing protein [Anaerolineae bacterium]